MLQLILYSSDIPSYAEEQHVGPGYQCTPVHRLHQNDLWKSVLKTMMRVSIFVYKHGILLHTTLPVQIEISRKVHVPSKSSSCTLVGKAMSSTREALHKVLICFAGLFESNFSFHLNRILCTEHPVGDRGWDGLSFLMG